MIAASSSAPQKPRDLPSFKISPRLNLERDAVRLDQPHHYIPDWLNFEVGTIADIKATHHDWAADNEYGEPDFGYSDEQPSLMADVSEYSEPWLMKREGFTAALAAAKAINRKEGGVHAILEDAKSGRRYIVPLGVRVEYDESMLEWNSVGGIPHWKGAKNHTLLEPRAEELEAVVFNGGKQWNNFTGHPVKLDRA